MPIIIFGTRGRIVNDEQAGSTTGQCSRCGQIVSFEPVRQRRYFTLFFLPVLPLEKGESLLRCPSCKALFHRRDAFIEP